MVDALLWGISFFWFVIVVLVVALMVGNIELKSLSILFLILLAAGAVGGVLGFIFAVPRVMSQPEAVVAPSADDTTESRKRKARLLSTNTNLERISDWLATMLVGVGLSQIGQVNTYLGYFSVFLEQNLPYSTASFYRETGVAAFVPTAGLLLLIVGVSGGFVGLYLFTRLMLVPKLNEVEQNLTTPEDAELKGAVSSEVTQLAQQISTDSPTTKLTVSRRPTVGESLNVMYAALYENDGYKKVIDLSALLRATPAAETADFWYYLACAFGQKQLDLLEKKMTGGLTPDAERELDIELASTRDNILDCVKRTLAIDEEYNDTLWYVSDPNGAETDLSGMRKDNDFRRLVGRRRV